MNISWDYANLADFYDKRADYSTEAIQALVKIISTKEDMKVADVGAGTGKLTVPLCKNDLNVTAIEPNDAMRQYGIQNDVA